MKKNYFNTSLLAVFCLVLFFSMNLNGQTINGIELPPPCTNCSGTVTSSSKTASTLGISTQATDTAAFASGKGSIASGLFSTAFGYYSQAKKNSSFAAGYMAVADSNYSVALGYKAATSSPQSVAIGNYVKAAANNSLVIGKGDAVNQLYLTNNIANSIIFGVGTTTPTMIIRGGELASRRVGIKTTNPQADLDVNGTLRANSFQLTLSPESGYVMKADASGNASWADPKTLGIWNLNGNHAYYNTNVGIGTSSPTAMLEVAGTLKTQNMNISGGADGYVLKSDASGNASWADPKTLGIWNLNGNHAYYNSNVGIGTSSPTAMLEVAGTLKTQNMNISGGADGYVLKSDASGNATWANPDDLFYWQLNAQSKLITDKSTGVAIAQGQDLYGNFQIGSDFTFWGANSSDNKIISNNYYWNNGPKRISNGSSSRIVLEDQTGNIKFNMAPYGAAHSEITGEWVVFTADGKVGIGEENPSSELEVDGMITAGSIKLSGGANGQVLVSDSQGLASWTNPIAISPWDKNPDGDVYTSDNAGVSIPAGTDVIGNFQMGTEFTISGAGIDLNKIIGNNHKWDNGSKRINDGCASTIVLHDQTGSISLNAGGSGIANAPIVMKTMIFTSSGTLGIGTISPQHTLDVQAPLQASARIYSQNASKSTIWAGNSLRSFGFGVDATGSGHIYRSAAEDNLMTFTPDGKVLIGNNISTPGSHKLYVEGSIVATEVTIAEVSSWSDFVFESGYHLPALHEVKTFIETYGHLPGVPSAKEVKESGINLAQTDALLLQKIEELTLYVLQQEEKIVRLQEVINELNAE